MIVVFFLCLLGFFLGYWAGRLLKLDFPTVQTVALNAGMRNISAGAVLAEAYFPGDVPVSGGLFSGVPPGHHGPDREGPCGPPGPAGRIRRPTKRAWRRNRPGNGICSVRMAAAHWAAAFPAEWGTPRQIPPAFLEQDL